MEANFSAPAETIIVDGVLTDFDGTIIDSTAAIIKHWHKYVGTYLDDQGLGISRCQ